MSSSALLNLLLDHEKALTDLLDVAVPGAGNLVRDPGFVPKKPRKDHEVTARGYFMKARSRLVEELTPSSSSNSSSGNRFGFELARSLATAVGSADDMQELLDAWESTTKVYSYKVVHDVNHQLEAELRDGQKWVWTAGRPTKKVVKDFNLLWCNYWNQKRSDVSLPSVRFFDSPTFTLKYLLAKLPGTYDARLFIWPQEDTRGKKDIRNRLNEMRIRLYSIAEDAGGQDVLLQQMAMDQESQSRHEAEIMSKIMKKERHDKIENQEEAFNDVYSDGWV